MPARIKAFGLSALIAATAMISHANATDVSGQLKIKLNVQNSCVLKSGDNSKLDFGSHMDLMAEDIYGQTSTTAGIQVQCGKGQAYSIYLNGGLNPKTDSNGKTTFLRMMNGTNFIFYALYQDSAHTKLWGWDDVPTNGVSQTGTGAAQDFPVYGRMIKQSTPPAGIYTDTVTVKVKF